MTIKGLYCTCECTFLEHFTLMYVSESVVGTFKLNTLARGERSGSVVECLTRDRGAAGWSLTRITMLWSLSKTHLS